MTQAGGGTETGSPGMRVATETCGQRIPLKFSTTVWEYWIRVDLRRRPAPPDAQRKRCSHRVGACSTILIRLILPITRRLKTPSCTMPMQITDEEDGV